MAFAPSIDADIWYCVATTHERNNDLHQADLLKHFVQVHKTLGWVFNSV